MRHLRFPPRTSNDIWASFKVSEAWAAVGLHPRLESACYRDEASSNPPLFGFAPQYTGLYTLHTFWCLWIIMQRQ